MPLIKILPLLASKSFVISLIRVVLPAPFSPTMAIDSPFLIVRLIFFKISLSSSYAKETSSSFISSIDFKIIFSVLKSALS